MGLARVQEGRVREKGERERKGGGRKGGREGGVEKERQRQKCSDRCERAREELD